MLNIDMRKILVTGGLGFIASHVTVDLVKAGCYVVVIDNLCNSSVKVLDKIKRLVGSNYEQLRFIRGDVKDKDLLKRIFIEFEINLVMHFAGLKSVSDSVKNPLTYYQNNVVTTLTLLEVMHDVKCSRIVFSSSATVYGSQQYPVSETAVTGVGITNPYGNTKYMIEEILKDVYNSRPDWKIVILRYFNPIGAHPSGLLGEDPKDVPNNLFPYLLNVAIKKSDKLLIFGGDYDTPDGTCIRDFIHVSDLSLGHLYSLKKIDTPGVHTYNLGTGFGISVKQLVDTFEQVTGVTVDTQVVDRRVGDLPIVYSNVYKAFKELQWTPKKNIKDMCRDGWNFIKNTV